MPRISLDCLTLTDTTPADLIRSAESAGFDLVSLWVNPPPVFPLQIVTHATEAECASLLASTGVGVSSLEAFDLVSERSVQASRAALELGARLGARAAVALNAANPDRSQVVDLLAAFAEIAGECGLGVNVEPISMGRTRTLAEARDLIRDAGVDAGIVFDVLHLVRTGGGAREVRAIEPGLIRHVQINDGPATIPTKDLITEAVAERLYPGEGEFPLVELLRAAPSDVPWALETPSVRRARSGMSPKAQAIEAMAALRRLLAEVNV
jgi:sugar phosphate isomerase/epimerase